MSLDLDLTNVEATGGTIEAGEYTATIDEASVQDTKAGTGKYIKTRFRTPNGFVYHNFNIKNPNAKAQEIGLGQLKTLLKVCGKEPKLSDVNMLLGLTCTIRVKIEDSDYGEQARITSFKAAKVESKADGLFA